MPQPDPSDYFDTSMNDSINPFDTINENPKYPLARLYRRSFWSGIADTYDVLVGNHYRNSRDEETHCGFLDVLVFPLLSQWLMRIAFPDLKLIKLPPREWEKTHLRVQPDGSKIGNTYYEIPGTMPLPIRILAGTLAFLLELPRGLLGIALTLVLSPAVALVHVALFPKANQLKNAVNEVKVVPEQEEEPVPLQQFLGKYFDLNDITVTKAGTYVKDEMGKWACGFSFFESKEKGHKEKQAFEAIDELNIGGQRVR